MATFTVGQKVFARDTNNVPVRYHNRSATIIGRVKAGRGWKYECDFSPRRATPIVLGARDLLAAN